jgi:hypothetical protein
LTARAVIVHPKQVLPNSSFCQFVISILHSTQVSFSVTILALMYTYKYEKVMALGLRPPFHSPVTEAQAFVTALMLANKYLDDNTYTNSTWAAFLKLSVKEVNEYELEWLDALQFNLHVGKEEFETWRAMLDAHVANQQRADAAAASNLVAVTSPGRARSESPPLAYYAPAGLTPSADHHIMRKRSARDAFATDLVHNTGFYEAARLRPRKSSFVSLAPMAFPAAPPAPTALVPQANNGAMGLGRSSSLTRQIARLPTGRRDSSAGQENAMLDLRHAAAVNAAQTWQFPANGALSAGQPRLYFLQAAATPLAGPDGRFHKSIPHYFDPNFNPNFQFPMPQVQRHEMMDVDMNQVDLTSPTEAVHMAAVQPIMVPTLAMPLPHPTGIPMHFPEPQPAQFANAGPPGYAYGAQGWSLPAPPPPPQWQRTWKPGHASRWSTSSDEGLVFNLPRAPMCHTEWPTPVPVRY